MVKLHLEYTATFRKLYKKLPGEIQKKADKTLLFLEQNPGHPSLHFKKMEGTEDIYEWRISDNYRGTLKKTDSLAYLRKIGAHDILRNP